MEPEFCKNVIEKFEKDDGKYQGTVGTTENMSVNKSIKDSMDLHISDQSHWKEEDDIFFKSLNEHHNIYVRESKWTDIHNPFEGFNSLDDIGYQIQRTTPGTVGYNHLDGYHKNHDSQSLEVNMSLIMVSGKNSFI